MEGFVTDWLNLVLRCLHVIVAIAWIGESFYFVALDNSLKPPQDPNARKRGVFGDFWHVHGGGFYHMQKYSVAPHDMPESLHWSFWPSYTTWMSGFGLFFVLYLLSPSTYLIDKNVLDMGPVVAVSAALGFLMAGWIVYDSLCRLLGNNDKLLGICVGIYVLIAAWLACHVFAGRAAYLITGAMLATIMSANVFFVIIPGQRKMVAAMLKGETPNAIYGKRGKQRSVHNTYFTLPVVFAMLSNHYAMTYTHKYNWADSRAHHAGGRADPAVLCDASSRPGAVVHAGGGSRAGGGRVRVDDAGLSRRQSRRQRAPRRSRSPISRRSSSSAAPRATRRIRR